MVEVNTLSAAAFETIAEAQATYGVPDRMIARIAQCSDSQITRNRKLVGWSLRKVSTAYLRGQVPKKEVHSANELGLEDGSLNLETDMQTDEFSAVNTNAIRTTIEKLMWRLSKILAVDDVEDIDPFTLKRIEGVGAAAKHFEKLLELHSKAVAVGLEAQPNAQKDPKETARILQKIEKRVHELAEQKARNIVLKSTERNGDLYRSAGMDD